MKLTERAVPKIEPPAKGYRLVGDDEIPGFSVRVTKNSARAFIFQYIAEGRTRRLTIGSWPAWSVTAAREEAKMLRRRVELGEDPQAEKAEAKAAPTFAGSPLFTWTVTPQRSAAATATASTWSATCCRTGATARRVTSNAAMSSP